MTIWDLPKKTSGKVARFNLNMPENLKTRLNEMGFTVGQLVTCMKRTPFNGPLVIQVQDCVYSVDKQIASQIEIQS
ncbi:FeoA family protein [Glaciecola sp. 1036]|uniref:FeoA family protein n=1 Tax=Alteromonadaceae TaxID=72275 RepID=UPI003D058DDE